VNLVIRPVHDVFLEEVAFPALAVGVVDAASGLGKLLESIADERVSWLLGRVLDRTVGGSFFGLVDDEWLELVHVLLFSEWERRLDGWHVSAEHPGYAASYELALHVALMLQDPSYPYADAQAAERFRDEWLGKVIKSGPVALVAGIWDPFPSFPPDQVLVTVGRSTYAPSENLAIADWSYRPSHAVKSWERRLDDQLKNLVGRERSRLGPVSLRESDELLAYWTGRLPEVPALSVAFSGLGPTASAWVREVGELSRLIRNAAAAGHGLTSLLTRRVGRSSSRSRRTLLQQDGDRAFVDEGDLHLGREDAFLHVQAQRPQRVARARVEAAGVLGRRGLDEARAAALPGVGIEGELAHHQRRAMGVEEREIHLPGRVLEDPEAGDPVCDRHRLGLGISPADAEQDQQPRTDGAHVRPRR
jgi:hypothetical protein